jgi:hypothetical protein
MLKQRSKGATPSGSGGQKQEPPAFGGAVFGEAAAPALFAGVLELHVHAKKADGLIAVAEGLSSATTSSAASCASTKLWPARTNPPSHLSPLSLSLVGKLFSHGARKFITCEKFIFHL